MDFLEQFLFCFEYEFEMAQIPQHFKLIPLF